MRRAILIAAALAPFAGGCVIESRSNLGTADVYWTFWSQSLGNIGAPTDAASAICGAAAADEVQIQLVSPSGVTYQPSSVACVPSYGVPGARFTDLDAGTWSYQVVGLRGGTVAYRSPWSTFDVFGRQVTTVDARLAAIPGNWDVVVTYTTASCPAGGSIRFSVKDSAGNVVYSTASGPNPPVSVPCAASATWTLPSFPAGDYTFTDWIQVDGTNAPVAYNACRQWWTQLSTANTTGLTVAVTAAAAPAAGNAGLCVH